MLESSLGFMFLQFLFKQTFSFSLYLQFPGKICVDCICSLYPPQSFLVLLGVTILLSMTIFLNTVQMIIPITSASPLIGKLQVEDH